MVVESGIVVIIGGVEYWSIGELESEERGAG